MSQGTPRFAFNPWGALMLAVALAGCSFLLQGRQGLNLADEGFLWCGVQRTAGGEVPLRDFQSYDPGRYYWCAAGTSLFGKGLVALRFSETVFQALGLWAGLLAVNRVARDWKLLGLVGLMLTLWMFPSHKLFDHTLLLTGILVAVRMLELASRGRVFAAGFFVGLCTFFGRNHALYNFVATGALLLLLCLKARKEVPASRIALWCVGVAVGLIPMLLMLLWVPGFFVAYRESVESVFRNGTNLGLPIPWPWQTSYIGDPVVVINRALFGVFSLALPICYLLAIALCLRMSANSLREHALFVACAFLGLLYAHHVFSRADFSHLAQAIHPFTLGVCAALALFGLGRTYLWVALAAFTTLALISVGRQTPFYQRLISPVPWVPYDAGGKIFVPVSHARLYDCLRQFVTKNMSPEETLFIAPFTPGLYPLLDRPSSVWELYFFFPATEERQAEAIRMLAAQRVNWAIVSDATLDGRDDLRLASTHKLLWRYLMENFQAVCNSCLPKVMKILQRKRLSATNNSSLK
jgi:hypothetical protein